MKQSRREFLDETLSPWKKALGIAGVAFVVSRCSSKSSPTFPTETPAVPRVELQPATGNYTFVVKANERIASARQALELAGLTVDTQDKSNWLTTVGQPFAGSYVRKINELPKNGGQWLINFGDSQFCGDIDNVAVPAGTIIGCHIDDGKHRTFTC